VSQSALLEVTGPLLRAGPAVDTNGLPALQLFWRVSDYSLEMSDSPQSDSWQYVEGASSGMVLPVPQTQKFYRLRWND
jgi:hypothetical protein